MPFYQTTICRTCFAAVVAVALLGVPRTSLADSGAITYDSQFIDKFGSTGTGLEQFRAPRGILINSTREIYVSDRDNDRIQVYDINRNFLRDFDIPGSSDVFTIDEFDNGDIITAGVTTKRVLRMQPDGTAVYSFVRPNRLAGIGVLSDGNVVVSEFDDDAIRVFQPDGTIIQSLAAPGNALGEVDGPTRISVESDDLIHVTDRRNNRVQTFSINTGFIRSFSNSFSDPDGISHDNYGNIYVVDRLNHRVQIFNSNCSPLNIFGSNGMTGYRSCNSLRSKPFPPRHRAAMRAPRHRWRT